MTGERLPKRLRTREAVAQQQGPAHVPYWNSVVQADFCHADGENWPCLWFRQNQPAPCKCSHAGSLHTRDEGHCWIAVCGCARFRPQETT